MSARPVSRLVAGARVRLIVDGSGEVEGHGEVSFQPGELGRIDAVELYNNKQGVVVRVVADCGVVNDFDWEDGPLSMLIEIVEDLEEREPIDTAPKDGSRVDLRQGEVIAYGCWWTLIDKGWSVMGVYGWALAPERMRPTHWRRPNAGTAP